MSKKTPATAGAVLTENPLDRIRAAHARLGDIDQAIRNVVRDLEAANLALLDKTGAMLMDADSQAQPIPTCERIESILSALDGAEASAKDAAKEAREAGKLAEHQAFGVRTLYREVLARGEHERQRIREREASRQTAMFDAARERDEEITGRIN